MDKRIVQRAAMVGFLAAAGVVVWRLGIPRLSRSSRNNDVATPNQGATLYDDEAEHSGAPASADGPDVREGTTGSKGGAPPGQVTPQASRDETARSSDAAPDEATADWQETDDKARGSFMRSWRIEARWPRVLWIVLGMLFVIMGAFSAHASWRGYDGLMTGFVILAVFSSVSAALSRDSVVAAMRVPIGKDLGRLLTDDTLRLLTLTVLGVLFTALYPMIPAVRHLVAFFAGGALSAATVSVLAVLARNVDIAAVIGLKEE